MKPGIAPAPLAISPLKRISPSRFIALKDCVLREIWTAMKQPSLLPTSPTAILGRIIHKLLEEAGKGQFGKGNTKGVEKRWAELVYEIEQQMKGSWLERSLVPLRRTVPDYEVRKIRAFRKAVEIASEATASRHKTIGKSRVRFEVWVESSDGLIGGFIDQVQETDEGAVLRDYKSGHVLDKQKTNGELKIKDEYEAQLKLYAALYQSTFGRWPVRLEIVPLHGANQPLLFYPTECTNLLEDATDFLVEINRGINEMAASSAEASERFFANPSPSVCRLCQFRPGCSAYRDATDMAAEDQWPQDVWGTVTEIRELGNGRISVSLQVANRQYAVAHIRGLGPSLDRHPALQLISQGDQIAAYSLQRSASLSSFSETPATVIYREQKS